MVILSIIALYLYVKHILRSHIKLCVNNCLRHIAFVGWLCFVVVKVYYEGALTMFFTAKNDLPFNTIEVCCF